MTTMSSHEWYRVAGVIGCAAVLMAGCASVPKPTEQIAVSRSAVANAAAAGGSEYAPAEMRSAQQKMDRAHRAMDREDYESARWLAEEAQVDARLAEKKAQSAKAQRAAVVMGDDIRVLRDEINRKSK
jgi:hypothetical protein